MAGRTLLRRLASPVGFLLVAGCFLLPFITVSCGSRDGTDTVRAAYSGLDLANGRPATVEPNPGGGAPVDAGDAPASLDELIDLAAAQGFPRPIDSQPLITGALWLAVLGAAVALVPWPWWRALAGTAIAVLALISLTAGGLISQRAALDRAEQDLTPLVSGRTGPGTLMIAASLAYGYYLALGGLVILALGSALAVTVHSRRISVRTEPKPEPEPAPSAAAPPE